MTRFVGLDVSQKITAICVVDDAGRRLWRGQCPTNPEQISILVRRHAGDDARIGVETGAMTPSLLHERRAHAAREGRVPHRPGISAWQNGYTECLIRSVRRECTDHLIALNAEHLRRILAKYAIYYNEVRTHVSLGKDASCTRPIERLGDVVAHPILGGLHHRYARI
jgi:Integrase core domain